MGLFQITSKQINFTQARNQKIPSVHFTENRYNLSGMQIKVKGENGTTCCDLYKGDFLQDSPSKVIRPLALKAIISRPDKFYVTPLISTHMSACIATAVTTPQMSQARHNLIPCNGVFVKAFSFLKWRIS